jgi:hypothetical protein
MYQPNLTDLKYIIKYNFGDFINFLCEIKNRAKRENYEIGRILIQKFWHILR